MKVFCLRWMSCLSYTCWMCERVAKRLSHSYSSVCKVCWRYSNYPLLKKLIYEKKIKIRATIFSWRWLIALLSHLCWNSITLTYLWHYKQRQHLTEISTKVKNSTYYYYLQSSWIGNLLSFALFKATVFKVLAYLQEIANKLRILGQHCSWFLVILWQYFLWFIFLLRWFTMVLGLIIKFGIQNVAGRI